MQDLTPLRCDPVALCRRALTGVLLTAALVTPVLVLRRVPHPPPAGSLEDPKSKGPAKAPVQITEFSSFSCFHCRNVQEDIRRVLQAHPGKTLLRFRHYFTNDRELLAHVAAEAAARQGKFWAYHDRLFAAQEVWAKAPDPRPFLLEYAQDLGLDMEKFQRDVRDLSLEGRVRSEHQAAQEMGIRVTPSFLIRDRLVVGEEEFRRQAEPILKEMLRRS